MSKYRLKKRAKGAEDAVEINVTPMIDMFSVLNSFLLMTAVFSAFGLVRVEIPFFSSKPPPTQEDLDKSKERVVTVTVDLKEVMMDTTFTNSNEGSTREKFAITEKGMDDLQAKVYQYRIADKKFDKVTIMTELDVPYETLVQVLDALRVLKPSRTPIQLPVDYKLPNGVDRAALVPKIVLGNVIL